MKQIYTAPEMEIRRFETENICAISNPNDGTDHIPETEGKDIFGW